VKWIIYSCEHKGYWGPNRESYVKDVDKAGRYSFEEARQIVQNSNGWLERGKILPQETMCPDWNEGRPS
jgi:hypothetical protein